MIKFSQSGRAQVIAVIVLVVCAAALCKPFAWLSYLANDTPFYAIAWTLPRILPTLAAFTAGPVGAVIVAFGAVCPMFFTYEPHHEMFIYHSLSAVGTFLALTAFSIVFYILAKRGGRKNIVSGLICGTLDHLFVGMLSGILAFRTIDKTTPIQIFPMIVIFLLALTAHAVVFLLQRGERAARRE